MNKYGFKAKALKKYFINCCAAFLLYSLWGQNFVLAQEVGLLEQKRQKAVLMARAGDYANAIAIFEQDLNVNSSLASDDIVFDYIDILNWAGDDAKVIALYENRYAAVPGKVDGYTIRLIAGSYYRQRQFVKAQKLYKLGLENKDKISNIGFEKTQLWLGEKNFDSDGISVDAAREYAVELARLNSFNKAIKIMTSLIENNPSDKLLYYDLISIYSWSGQEDKAMVLYETFLADKVQQMPIFAQKTVAGIYLSLGKYQEAQKLYLLAYAKGDETALLASAQVDARIGNVSEAMAVLDNIVKNNPNDYNTYVMRANTYMYAGLYTDASKDYDKALSLVDADNVATIGQIISTKAAFFIRASEFAEARDLLEPYVKNNTATAFMQADYIVCLQGTGEYSKAVLMGEGMWVDKTNVPTYGLRALADCYLRLKNYSKALEYHKLVIARNTPDKRLSMLSYAYCLAATNKVAEAKVVYSRLVEEFPIAKTIVSGDAKGLFERGRFHAGKAVFKTLIDNDAAYGPYREQFAFKLYTNAMPREAYREYKKLTKYTAFKEIGYAGMVQSAIDFGDYKAAREALKELDKYDTGSKEAIEARKAWVNRWRGSLGMNSSLFNNYQGKDYKTFNLWLETDIGDSWRFLADVSSGNYKEDPYRQSIDSVSSGLSYVGYNFDIKVLGSFNRTDVDNNGYRLNARYFLNDFFWIGIDTQKANVTAPRALAHQIMDTSKTISINRRVGAKDYYSFSYLWDEYSDNNRNRGFNIRFSHTSLATDKKEISWYITSSQYNWKFESPYYDSPARRVSYGPGFKIRWITPRVGYIDFVAELNSSYDLPDKTDFTPFFRLEKGWQLSAKSTLAVGIEYGARTNRTQNNNNLNFGYRQIDIRYYLSW